MNKEDLECMIRDIKEYLEEAKQNVYCGESETLIEDLKEIINSYEEEN